MKHTIQKRLLAILLTLVLLVSLLPSAFAAEDGDGGSSEPEILEDVTLNRQNLSLVVGESDVLEAEVHGISMDDEQ